jgi:hypothetical protein
MVHHHAPDDGGQNADEAQEWATESDPLPEGWRINAIAQDELKGASARQRDATQLARGTRQPVLGAAMIALRAWPVAGCARSLLLRQLMEALDEAPEVGLARSEDLGAGDQLEVVGAAVLLLDDELELDGHSVERRREPRLQRSSPIERDDLTTVLVLLLESEEGLVREDVERDVLDVHEPRGRWSMAATQRQHLALNVLPLWPGLRRL